MPQSTGGSMTRRGLARSVVVAIALSAVGVAGLQAAAPAAADPAGLVFDSIHEPGSGIQSDGYVFWSAAGGVGPLFPRGSGFTATADADVSGVTLLASSACVTACADVQIYVVEENATGDGVVSVSPDPSAPGYVRVPDSVLPRSPVADPWGSYVAPVSLMFDTPLHVIAGHSYFVVAQDADSSAEGTHAELGLVTGNAPAGEIAAAQSFIGPTWSFGPCRASECLAMQLFSGSPQPLPRPIAVGVQGNQLYGSVPTWGWTGPSPVGVSVTGTVSCNGLLFEQLGPALPVGTYSVAGGTCGGLALSGPDSSGYWVEYVGESFTIVPTPLTVRADDVSRPYGLPNPALTYSVTGLVNGDTATVLNAQPSTSTGATSASEPGVYAIAVTPAGLYATNYAVSVVSGQLTITRAVPVISAAPMRVSAALSGHQVRFAAVVHNTSASGPAVPGVPVTFSARSALGAITCTATTDASGTASCTSSNFLGFALAIPRSYTVTIPGTLRDYTGASTTAKIVS